MAILGVFFRFLFGLCCYVWYHGLFISCLGSCKCWAWMATEEAAAAVEAVLKW